MLVIAAAFPPLGRPPLWEAWLFESPWTLIALCAGVGLALAVTFVKRGQLRAAFGSVGVAAGVAALAIALSLVVTTDRERLRAGTRAFVQAVTSASPGEVSELLRDDLRVVIGATPVSSLTKQTLVEATRAFDGDLEPRSWRMGDLEAETTAPARGETRFSIRLTPRDGYPSISVWGLRWALGADGAWVITELTCHRLNGRTPDARVANAIERYAR